MASRELPPFSAWTEEGRRRLLHSAERGSVLAARQAERYLRALTPAAGAEPAAEAAGGVE